MSQNNTIKQSDKKFIRTEKARIRREFLDVKKQEELINELYKKFIKVDATVGKKEAIQVTAEVKKEIKKEAKKVTTKKPALKKAAVK